MLGPPRQRQGRCVGPSFAATFYWAGVAAVASAAGYTIIRPWLSPSLPPLIGQVSAIEFAMSAVASLGGIVIAGVVVAGAAYLFDRLTQAQSESSASTETTVQPSQEAES